MYDAVSFEKQYHRRRSELEAAAQSLEDYLSFALTEDRVLFHAVTFRLKTMESAHRKILNKQYDTPWKQLMDMVAGRIFTYFKDDARPVEDVVRKHFEVDEKNSINKADRLGYNEFGYTSRHLICFVGDKTQDLKVRTALREMKFEVQIRTVLEHGWAEVEHELVYKARTRTPDDIRRRFAASAASLELIESEFSRLRDFELKIVADRTVRIETSGNETLDRAWMLATLNYRFPNRSTWRPNPHEDNFYRGHEIEILAFLGGNKIDTVGKWDRLLTLPSVKNGIGKYAKLKEMPADEVNHLAIALIACASAKAAHASFDLDELMDEELRIATGRDT